MKPFPNRMRPDAPPRPEPIEGAGGLPAAAAVSEHKQTAAEWLSDESSFSWDENDSFEWNAQDLLMRDPVDQNLVIRHDSDTTTPVNVLTLEESSAADSEENRGVDPYNTGRFETK